MNVGDDIDLVKVDANALNVYRLEMVPDRKSELVWTRLVRAHAAALKAIEGELKAAGLPALEWYDVLWELETGGDLRPRDLQGRLLLAQYNLSRLLDRMVAAKAVERRPCADDRRGQLIAITPAGRRLRQTMWPVYSHAIESSIGDRLGLGDAATLARLLSRLPCEDLRPKP